MHPGYLMQASEAVDRILEYIPSKPEIMTFQSADSLLGVDSKMFCDMSLSFSQAQIALEKAQELWRKRGYH